MASCNLAVADCWPSAGSCAREMGKGKGDDLSHRSRNSKTTGNTSLGAWSKEKQSARRMRVIFKIKNTKPVKQSQNHRKIKSTTEPQMPPQTYTAPTTPRSNQKNTRAPTKSYKHNQHVTTTSLTAQAVCHHVVTTSRHCRDPEAPSTWRGRVAARTTARANHPLHAKAP